MATVLFYNHTGKVSGAEQTLLLILHHLDKERFTPVVLSPADGPLQSHCQSCGTEWQQAPLLAARFTFNPLTFGRYCVNVARVAWELRRSFLGKKPALIHANSTRAGIVATLSTMGTGIPVLWHLHDFLPAHPVSIAVRLLALRSARTRIAGCSAVVVKEFAGNLFRADSKRVFVARGAIQVKEVRRATSAADYAEMAPSARAEGSFVIGILGQISARKGHSSLIRAFAKLVSHCPQAQLVIAGTAMFNRDHEYAASLHTLVAKLAVQDRVHFLGFCEDVPRLMRGLDLLVLNSTAEPLGLVVLEAMLQGTPVLATDSGGPREMIEHGVNGHLIPVADESALETALVDLYRDPGLRARYRTAGPKHVRDHFSADNYIERIHFIYDTVLGQGSQPTGASASSGKSSVNATELP